ncbi:MAG: nuclear transport factor 2 family protein [Myxococcota bacterium]
MLIALLAGCAHPGGAVSPDEAAVTTIVESVAVLADRGEFDALSRLYADEFTLDYSSLNAQPVAKKTPLALMAEWASVLPGFDRTRHALSGVAVGVSGDLATARADVTASHWIGGDVWRVSGRYHYALRKRSGRWRITSMTFTLGREEGSREILQVASELAASRDLPGNHRVRAERNKQTVRRFFGALDAEDMSALVDLFTEDAVQRNPYHGGVFPPEARGEQALREYWTPLPASFDRMRFSVDALLATEDPDLVFVTFRGEITLKNGAGLYENHYYATFRFDDAGRIVEYVEVFDPVVAARAFGRLEELR